jgi:preprotein translocase SecE subunit
MSNYLKAVVKELRLTTFPTQNVVVNFTLFVILFTAAMAVYLGALDIGLGKGTISLIENLKASYSLGQNTPIVELASTTMDTATKTASVTDILSK